MEEEYPVLIYKTENVAGDGLVVVDELPPGQPIPSKTLSTRKMMFTRAIPTYTGFEGADGRVRETFLHPMNRTPLMTLLGTSEEGSSVAVVVKGDCYPMFYAYAPDMGQVDLNLLTLELDFMVRRSIMYELNSNRKMGWKKRKLREEQRVEMRLISDDLLEPYWIKSVSIKSRKAIRGYGHDFVDMLEIRVRNEEVVGLLVNRMASGVWLYSLGRSNRDLLKDGGHAILSAFGHTVLDMRDCEG